MRNNHHNGTALTVYSDIENVGRVQRVAAQLRSVANVAFYNGPTLLGTTGGVMEATLRTAVVLREGLKIIVMSATLDGEPVARLLGDAPLLTSQGKSYPVEVRYLSRDPDRDMVRATVSAVQTAFRETEGDILVFLPGGGEIRRCDVERHRCARCLEDGECPDGYPVKAKVATTKTKPRVYWELDATDPAKPYTPGPGSFIDDIITLAGGANIAASLLLSRPGLLAGAVVIVGALAFIPALALGPVRTAGFPPGQIQSESLGFRNMGSRSLRLTSLPRPYSLTTPGGIPLPFVEDRAALQGRCTIPTT